MTSQVIQSARPLTGRICPLRVQRVKNIEVAEEEQGTSGVIVNLAPEFRFSFWYFNRNQLEGKNKEFYVLKLANTTQETNLRNAQFKIKDLESSLKNEITLHQSIARRYEFHNCLVLRGNLIAYNKKWLLCISKLKI